LEKSAGKHPLLSPRIPENPKDQIPVIIVISLILSQTTFAYARHMLRAYPMHAQNEEWTWREGGLDRQLIGYY